MPAVQPTALPQPGEGLCPQNVNCEGNWGDCGIDCTRTWTEVVPASGEGDMCPAPQTCQPGADCPSGATVPCVG